MSYTNKFNLRFEQLVLVQGAPEPLSGLVGEFIDSRQGQGKGRVSLTFMLLGEVFDQAHTLNNRHLNHSVMTNQ